MFEVRTFMAGAPFFDFFILLCTETESKMFGGHVMPAALDTKNDTRRCISTPASAKTSEYKKTIEYSLDSGVCDLIVYCTHCDTPGSNAYWTMDKRDLLCAPCSRLRLYAWLVDRPLLVHSFVTTEPGDLPAERCKYRKTRHFVSDLTFGDHSLNCHSFPWLFESD
jgi:hypothetical protein